MATGAEIGGALGTTFGPWGTITGTIIGGIGGAIAYAAQNYVENGINVHNIVYSANNEITGWKETIVETGLTYNYTFTYTANGYLNTITRTMLS